MSMAKRVGVGCLGILLVLCLSTAVVGLVWQQTIRAFVEPIAMIFEAPEYAEGFGTPSQFATYLLAEQPGENIALVAYSVDDAGGIDEAETALFINADVPLPLASTAKIVILTAVAEAVADGQFSWETPIPLTAWEQYYLPGTDGGAHPAALEHLGIAANEQGFALDPTQTVTLDELTWAMIRYSDNAATDYLLAELGSERVEQVFQTAGLTTHDPLDSFLGLFLLWNNHDTPTLTDERVADLLALDTAVRRQQAQQLADQYLQDEAWRTAEIAWRAQRTPNRISHEIALATQTSPRASARDYAQLLALVATDNYVSPQVSADVRRFLEWPMVVFPSNAERFQTLGTKGGTLAGVLTSALYTVPQAGDFAGQTRVVVLFQSDPPFSAWLTQTQDFSYQNFMLEVATEQEILSRLVIE